MQPDSGPLRFPSGESKERASHCKIVMICPRAEACLDTQDPLEQQGEQKRGENPNLESELPEKGPKKNGAKRPEQGKRIPLKLPNQEGASKKGPEGQNSYEDYREIESATRFFQNPFEPIQNCIKMNPTRPIQVHHSHDPEQTIHPACNGLMEDQGIDPLPGQGTKKYIHETKPCLAGSGPFILMSCPRSRWLLEISKESKSAS
jgi:hypothetical protein